MSTYARYLFKEKKKVLHRDVFTVCLRRICGLVGVVTRPKQNPAPDPVCLTRRTVNRVTCEFVQTSNRSQRQNVDTGFYEPQKSFESYLLKELTQPAWK